VIEPETGGFVRGVLRSLVRRRMQLGLGREAGGFDLNRLSDGQITLSDPATGEIVDLGAFGPTNQAAFAAIMSPELAR
jgi:putative photosynthetic complex assembly protein